MCHKIRYVIIIILLISFPLFGQKTKESIKQNKEQKEESKSAKKKNEIIFSNNQDTRAYLEMLENALRRVSTSYVDSVNQSELINLKMDP